MDSKKKIIIICAIVFVVILSIVIIKNKKSKNSTQNNYVAENIMNSEAKKKELKKALKSCEDDYKQAIAVAPDIYDRNAFYNSERIQMNYYDGLVRFVNGIDATKYDELLDAKGNKVEKGKKLKTPTYQGQNVTISDYERLEVGKYYLIKYEANEEEYSYCYVGKLGENGFEDFDLYCITKESLWIDYMENDLYDLDMEDDELYDLDLQLENP